MKKHAAILSLAALVALPACSGQSGYHGRGDTSSMSPNQSYSQAGAEYDENDHGRWHDGDHKAMMDAKVDAMTDYFFDHADMNHDGFISRREFDRFLGKKFREADTNNDGKLSRDEVRAMKRREMREMHHQMHGDMKDGDMRRDGDRMRRSSDRESMQRDDRDNFDANQQ